MKSDMEPTAVPGRLWKKKQAPPPPTNSLLSKKKKKRGGATAEMCCEERMKKKHSRVHGSSKRSSFFFVASSSRHREKRFQLHCGTQVWHPTPPQGCGVQALAISQIQALFSLPSKFLFYTCSHAGALDPKKPRVDKQISPERNV